MAQKRKTNHSKSARKGSRKTAGKTGAKSADTLAEAEDLLRAIEDKTARGVDSRLTDNWRDNLFEIMMTRVDLAAPHKELFRSLPPEFRRRPERLPHFARLFWRTMKNMLALADAPAKPHHVAVFGALYMTVVDAFLKDDTRDHAKTMAVLDRRLETFQKFVDLSACR